MSLKLIRIEGNIWELTPFQRTYELEASDFTKFSMSREEVNESVIRSQDMGRGTIRMLSSHAVRSKAKAVIETEVRGLPTQIAYDIYHNNKGFFCKVQGYRYLLKDILDEYY